MEAEKFIQSLVDSVERGEIRPLDAYAILYRLNKASEDALNTIKPQAISERLKYDKKEDVIRGGYYVQVGAGRATYKYDHEPAWVQYEMLKKNIEEMMKRAAIRNEAEAINPATGETLQPAKVSYSSETIIMKKGA